MASKGSPRRGAGRKKNDRPTKVIRVDEQLAIAIRQAIKTHSLQDILAALATLESNENQGEDSDIVSAEPISETCDGNLNADQQKANDALMEWWHQNKKSASLSGAAGTGKTYTIGYWIKALKAIAEISPIFVTPTHKAKKVLKAFLAKANVKAEVYTIAQALGKQPIINDEGAEDFQNQGKSNFIQGASLVICDEASMVAKDDYQEILDSCTRVLWLGDRYQLPPVGEDVSPAFQADPTTELTQVMRYTGHILAECEKLRTAVDRRIIYRPQPDGKSVMAMRRGDGIKLAVRLFKSPKFDADSSFCRLLAFRNARVDSCNKTLKRLIYGHCQPFFLGQKLIASRPVTRLVASQDDKGRRRVEWQILATNSEEMEVVGEIVQRAIDPDDLAHAPKLCQSLSGTITTFECLSESGTIFQSLILHKDAAESRQEHFTIAKTSWDKKAMQFLYGWGDELKDIFALTVHKGQGSSFNHVFVDIEDILRRSSHAKPGQKDMRPQMLYTAFSRASERVYILF